MYIYIYTHMYMLAAGKPYVRFCVFDELTRVGVGWDNSIQLYLYTYLLLRYRPVLLHLHTYLLLRYRWGGVGLCWVGWDNS